MCMCCVKVISNKFYRKRSKCSCHHYRWSVYQRSLPAALLALSLMNSSDYTRMTVIRVTEHENNLDSLYKIHSGGTRRHSLILYVEVSIIR